MLAQRKISLAYKAIVGASICRTSSLSRVVYASFRSGSYVVVVMLVGCRMCSAFVSPFSTMAMVYIGLGWPDISLFCWVLSIAISVYVTFRPMPFLA
jgi:hypothetical protein